MSRSAVGDSAAYSDMQDEDLSTDDESPASLEWSEAGQVKRSKVMHNHLSTQEINNNITTTTCLITREDKKPLPFNFYKSNLSAWKALSFLKPDTLHRNQKGTAITAEAQENKLSEPQQEDKTFTNESIT